MEGADRLGWLMILWDVRIGIVVELCFGGRVVMELDVFGMLGIREFLYKLTEFALLFG